ncbi:MAG: hypothetical protein HFH66_14260 [Lachnospiraceae bacterium]|nr:hypothetical protein [Lachnospiraceae bacterium]
MNHSFNVEVATKYGMLEAVLLENINFWVAKNKANEKNFYDGFYWTYNSITALSKLFPYASMATIFRALHNLEDAGLILAGNYNKDASDKTKWYTLTKKGELLLNGTEACQPESNAGSGNNAFQNETTLFQNETTLPYINTEINPDVNLTVSNDTVRRTDVQRVAEHWNQLAAYGVKPVISINHGTKRFDMLRARVCSYDIDKILEAIENIKKSSVLCGSVQKGWFITFDWFVRPNNFIKVLEGNYEGMEDKGNRNKSSPGSKPNQFNSFQQRDYVPADVDSLEKMLLAKNKYTA